MRKLKKRQNPPPLPPPLCKPSHPFQLPITITSPLPLHHTHHKTFSPPHTLYSPLTHSHLLASPHSLVRTTIYTLITFPSGRGAKLSEASEASNAGFTRSLKPEPLLNPPFERIINFLSIAQPFFLYFEVDRRHANRRRDSDQ